MEKGKPTDSIAANYLIESFDFQLITPEKDEGEIKTIVNDFNLGFMYLTRPFICEFDENGQLHTAFIINEDNRVELVIRAYQSIVNNSEIEIARMVAGIMTRQIHIGTTDEF
jgi:hypothetical protein